MRQTLESVDLDITKRKYSIIESNEASNVVQTSKIAADRILTPDIVIPFKQEIIFDGSTLSLGTKSIQLTSTQSNVLKSLMIGLMYNDDAKYQSYKLDKSLFKINDINFSRFSKVLKDYGLDILTSRLENKISLQFVPKFLDKSNSKNKQRKIGLKKGDISIGRKYFSYQKDNISFQRDYNDTTLNGKAYDKLSGVDLEIYIYFLIRSGEEVSFQDIRNFFPIQNQQKIYNAIERINTNRPSGINSNIEHKLTDENHSESFKLNLL